MNNSLGNAAQELLIEEFEKFFTKFAPSVLTATDCYNLARLIVGIPESLFATLMQLVVEKDERIAKLEDSQDGLVDQHLLIKVRERADSNDSQVALLRSVVNDVEDWHSRWDDEAHGLIGSKLDDLRSILAKAVVPE